MPEAEFFVPALPTTKCLLRGLVQQNVRQVFDDATNFETFIAILSRNPFAAFYPGLTTAAYAGSFCSQSTEGEAENPPQAKIP